MTPEYINEKFPDYKPNVEDFSKYSDNEQKNKEIVMKELRRIVKTPINLQSYPLMKVYLFKYWEDRYVYLSILPHISN